MRIHIVRPGDTLWKLAKRYNVPLQRLIDANPLIRDPDNLVVGMKVRIPTGGVPVRPPSKPSRPPYPKHPGSSRESPHHESSHRESSRESSSYQSSHESSFDWPHYHKPPTLPKYPKPSPKHPWGGHYPGDGWRKHPELPRMPNLPSMPYSPPCPPYQMPMMNYPMYGMPYPMPGMGMPYYDPACGCGGMQHPHPHPYPPPFRALQYEEGESSSL